MWERKYVRGTEHELQRCYLQRLPKRYAEGNDFAVSKKGEEDDFQIRQKELS